MSFEKFRPVENKNTDLRFTLRLTEEMHEELSKYAQNHNISINTLILNCISYAMSNREDSWN